MPLFTAMECPKCKKMAVFPTTRIIKIDGVMCGPISERCGECGWEPSEEELRKDWRARYKGPEVDS